MHKEGMYNAPGQATNRTRELSKSQSSVGNQVCKSHSYPDKLHMDSKIALKVEQEQK